MRGLYVGAALSSFLGSQNQGQGRISVLLPAASTHKRGVRVAGANPRPGRGLQWEVLGDELGEIIRSRPNGSAQRPALCGSSRNAAQLKLEKITGPLPQQSVLTGKIIEEGGFADLTAVGNIGGPDILNAMKPKQCDCILNNFSSLLALLFLSQTHPIDFIL